MICKSYVFTCEYSSISFISRVSFCNLCRHDLIPSLFELLRKLTKVDAVVINEAASTKHVESFHVSYVQQLVLEVLEKIVNSTQAEDDKVRFYLCFTQAD